MRWRLGLSPRAPISWEGKWENVEGERGGRRGEGARGGKEREDWERTRPSLGEIDAPCS